MAELNAFIGWISEHGGSIVRILLYSTLIYIFFRLLIWKATRALINKASKKKDRDIVKQRAYTLRDVLLKTAQIVFLIAILVAIMEESGVNVAPLLAGLGLLGVAVGFGTQGLIKDIVNGIFIILEGQYSKGDVVEIGDKKGKVEDVTLRKTVLRDLDGTVHHIPNNLVGVVSNKSQDWASVNLDIKVGCSEDLEKVIATLEKVGQNLYKDVEFSEYMLEAPQVLGVDNIEESKVTIKILGRTKHLKKWEVSREMRRRIKEAFDKQKIKFA